MSCHDTLARPLQYLRLSVTDRCNFRCLYCMPKESYRDSDCFFPPEAILSVEETVRLARIFADQGVRKIRLTGGGPLLRRDLEWLVEGLAALDGIDEIAVTTNGSLLDSERAARLREAGVSRVTVSLDAIQEAPFRAINDVGYPVSSVLEGIGAAEAAGLGPVKVNMVVKHGLNHHQILPLARYFRGTTTIPRFIEYMDVGNSNGWSRDEVIPADAIRATVDWAWPLVPIAPNHFGEVASRFRYADGAGEVGIIGSISHPFCRTCDRARLSARGELYTCLFGAEGHAIRPYLRDATTGDWQLAQQIRRVWQQRNDRYSELRSQGMPTTPKVAMARIGG